MNRYFDRQGNPLTSSEWGQLFSGSEDWRRDLKRVAETTLPNGRWVSTVWMGLNHQYGDGPPLIFETMVFASKDDMGDLDCERYSTEQEALAGHAAMVEKWTEESPDRKEAGQGVMASRVVIEAVGLLGTLICAGYGASHLYYHDSAFWFITDVVIVTLFFATRAMRIPERA